VPKTASEQFEVGAGAATFDDVVDFVRFARVLTLPSLDDVHLPTTGRKGARVLSPDAEKYQFGSVSKIESNAATVWAAILS